MDYSGVKVIMLTSDKYNNDFLWNDDDALQIAFI